MLDSLWQSTVLLATGPSVQPSSDRREEER
jgi:hypothetical protein